MKIDSLTIKKEVVSLAKNKIKSILIIDKDRTFTKERYVWFTFEDDTFKVMLFDDAIEFLQKYSILNRFRSTSSLLSSFNTEYETFDEYLRKDIRSTAYPSAIQNTIYAKEDELREVEKSLDIDLGGLSGMYWPGDETSRKKIMEQYEKIRDLVLETCKRENISYRTNKEDILKDVLTRLKKEDINLELYPSNIEEVQKLYDILKKRVQSKDNDYDFNNMEKELTSLKFLLTEYTAANFEMNYQLLWALSDKKKLSREEILKNWAEFLIILPDYINIINSVEHSVSQISKEKKISDLERFYKNDEFIEELRKLMAHDREKEIYRYHATTSLDAGLSILKNGLFMSSSDIDSTSFPEFSLDGVLTYEYGGMFTTVGDYIIIFKDPIDEDIMRETTEEERSKNKVASRRLFNTSASNDYVVEPKYIIGLVDKRRQKVIRLEDLEKENNNQEERHHSK